MAPSHCPYPECDQFHCEKAFDYVRNGFHATKAFGKVQRYRCSSCHRSFSDQSSSIDFYVKKPVPYKPIPMELGESLRDIGDPELRTVLESLARSFGD